MQRFSGEADLNRALAGYFDRSLSWTRNSAGSCRRCATSGWRRNTHRLHSGHGDDLGTRGLRGKATMYGESAGIPLILAVADVPAGVCCPAPVTPCDLSATILDAAGAGLGDIRPILLGGVQHFLAGVR